MAISWNLSLILILLVFHAPKASHALECVHVENCLCLEYENVEFQCPKHDPDISIQVTPKNKVEIQCQKNNTPFFDVDILPNIDLEDSEYLKLEFCYLNVSFSKILERFNMKNVKQLTFETLAKPNDDRVINVSKEMFENMGNLENLALGFSTLNLDIDFLKNTPNLQILSMTKNGLSYIDKYFKHVPKLRLLDLSRNQISSLPNGVFSDLKNLSRLYLWNNNLTGLTKGMFDGLDNLELLELSSNHIEVIAEDTFSQLKKLVTISFRNNNIKRAYSSMFSENILLQNARLNYNPNLVLSDYLFANLKSLQNVDLSDNGLKEIPENLFRNCANISEIALKGNQLTAIPGGLFNSLSTLKKLDLRSNKLSSLPPQVFNDLVKLVELNLANNQLTSIIGNIFRKLDQLEMINLSNNKINYIDPIAFRSFAKGLKFLDLSYNQWNASYTPIDVMPVADCLNLEELNLSHNELDHVPDINALLKLKKMDVSYNHIDYLAVSPYAKSTTFTIKIDLSNNEIEHVDFDFAQTVAEENYDAAHYNGASTEITIDNNPVLCDCSNYHLIRYNNDEMPVIKTLVEIKQDKLRCSNSSSIYVKTLKPEHIDCPVLHGCPTNCSCSYKPHNAAVIIDCSYCNLTEYPVFLFNETDHRQTRLNLRGNQLKDGPVQAFNYDNVTYLDLSGNQISEIAWVPPLIKELNLDENNLKRLSSEFISLLKNRTTIERVSLKQNAWECDCAAIELQNYLMDFYKKVNSSDVYCSQNDMYLVKITDLCKVSPYLTVLLPIVLVVLLFFAVAFAIYYRYQTEIKIYLYAKNLCLWFVTEEELDKDKTYDVFISYAHQEEKFVVEHLLPELERGETPYKACVHGRDWIPGEFIAQQIVNSVKDSRRTLVVLSNNFVDSVWGKLEFRTAHTEAVSEGRARVIVVIYGDVDEDKLDDELKSYLKTNTYVKWGDKYFWNKLKYAMPHSINSFYQQNRNQAKIMLKIDDKFDLIKTPPSPTNTSTPPITLDPSMLENNEFKISIPQIKDGEDPLLTRPS